MEYTITVMLESQESCSWRYVIKRTEPLGWIASRGSVLGTALENGFASPGLVRDALTDSGVVGLAWRLLLRSSCLFGLVLAQGRCDSLDHNRDEEPDYDSQDEGSRRQTLDA